jgi:hypothetical protein
MFFLGIVPVDENTGDDIVASDEEKFLF